MVKVNVYEGGKIIARVQYNDNLDYWDGKNWTCGSPGRHLGLTRLRKSGQYVLIHGTDFQGEQDRAEIVTDEEAYQAIASSGNFELLEKFPDLRRFEEDLDTDDSRTFGDLKRTWTPTRTRTRAKRLYKYRRLFKKGLQI